MNLPIKFSRNTRAQITGSVFLDIAIFLVVFALVLFIFPSQILTAGDNSKKLLECTGQGGECLPACTDEHPAFAAGAKFGCKGDAVCCQASKFNNIYTLYRDETIMSEFKPVPATLSIEQKEGKKIYFDFYVTEQNNAAYCRFSYTDGSGTHEFGLSEGGAAGYISAPAGIVVPPGYCPDNVDEVFYVFDAGSEKSVQLSIELFSRVPDGTVTPSLKSYSYLVHIK